MMLYALAPFIQLGNFLPLYKQARSVYPVNNSQKAFAACAMVPLNASVIFENLVVGSQPQQASILPPLGLQTPKDNRTMPRLIRHQMLQAQEDNDDDAH